MARDEGSFVGCSRPVHAFIAIAVIMGVVGCVLTISGGVSVYYHDVFRGAVFKDKAMYEKGHASCRHLPEGIHRTLSICTSS